MPKRQRSPINYNETTGEYIDCAVERGFPMGGIGSGGFNIGSDGRFTEFRLNNNWMNPIRNVRGTFFALHTAKTSRILRRSAPDGEFKNIQPIRSTCFKGELPGFELKFDDDMPVQATLRGFTPHIPHNIKDSTMPAALFTIEISNPGNEALFASALFSWENILGLGGTGNTGLKMLTRSIPIGPRGRVTYKDVSGNYQQAVNIGARPAVAFMTKQSPDSRSHRQSTIGEYRIMALEPEGFAITICEGWDSAGSSPAMLGEFVKTGKISSPAKPVEGTNKCRPAAAIAVSGEIEGGQSKEITFALAWWTADHVTEKDVVKKYKTGQHDGTRVGHVYENYFDGPDDVIEYVINEKGRLEKESFELPGLVEESTLPDWLKRAVKNSIDSTLCNTVVPKDGTMYTIEGMNWEWPFGGLTGTNDQRLSSHTYSSVFFTQLDMSEIDAFRRLMDERGSVPHGNGNCDIALGSADVPYGWPEEIIFVLPAKEWTDLAMSEIVQAGKLYRITGDRDWLDKFWPDMKRMAEYLLSISEHGVPEGGTTFDIWDFPGSFIYTATVYLAAMRTMIDLAGEIEPEMEDEYWRRYTKCEDRINNFLWVDSWGYFRSTPRKNTVFTAALAGDWVARYAGIGPVIDPDRARRHMELQHHTLIERPRKKAAGNEKIPKPNAHAKPDGSLIRQPNLTEYLLDSIYIWQVLSYQGMEHIYLGQVDLGLDVMKMIYDRIYKKGLTWGAGLMANPDSVYMTHPVIWALFNAITGAALDAPRGILHIAPQPLCGEDTMRVPFFFPRFWAMMTYDPKTGECEIEIKKHFGKPVIINKIARWVASGECLDIELESPVEFSTGTIWKGELQEK